jgi:hypothetical protein
MMLEPFCCGWLEVKIDKGKHNRGRAVLNALIKFRFLHCVGAAIVLPDTDFVNFVPGALQVDIHVPLGHCLPHVEKSVLYILGSAGRVVKRYLFKGENRSSAEE